MASELLEAVPYIDERLLRWAKDPAAFVAESFTTDPYGYPVEIDPAQVEILEAVRDHDRVCVRSGRGVGKTASAAMITHWWLATRQHATVVTSAGSWGHLEDKLWPEIGAWGKVWTLKEAFEYQQMAVYKLDSRRTWRAEATSSDKPVNVEGFHSPHLLILIDEAKGMADEVWAALQGSLTAQYRADRPVEQKVVVLSTPPLAKVGWFAGVSTSSRWKTIHVSGLDSPRVSREFVEEIRDSYGEGSPEYESYVLGEIPEAAAETVIQTRWVEKAQSRHSNKSSPRLPVVTCDVAREGEDLSTFGIFKDDHFDLDGWLGQSDLMEVAGRCMRIAMKNQASHLVIDDTGLGGGVTDRLREMQSEGTFPHTCSITPVKFARKARNPRRFHSIKDELWWGAREALRLELLSLPTDEQIRRWKAPKGSDFKTQLCQALYEYDSLDRIRVLDKRIGNREKTKALPTKSPDLAHAFILGVRYYIGQDLEEAPSRKPTTSEEALWQRVQEMVERAKKPPIKDPYRRRRE